MPNTITVTGKNVRDAIDMTMPSRALPDTTITASLHAKAAIKQVKRLDPDWATRSGEEAEALNLAADYFTAALFLPTLPNITRMQIQDGPTEVREPVNVAERVADLEGLAMKQVSIALGESESDVAEFMPTMFGLACGRRGA
jgi:hypothetical protein